MYYRFLHPISVAATYVPQQEWHSPFPVVGTTNTLQLQHTCYEDTARCVSVCNTRLAPVLTLAWNLGFGFWPRRWPSHLQASVSSSVCSLKPTLRTTRDAIKLRGSHGECAICVCACWGMQSFICGQFAVRTPPPWRHLALFFVSVTRWSSRYTLNAFIVA